MVSLSRNRIAAGRPESSSTFELNRALRPAWQNPQLARPPLPRILFWFQRDVAAAALAIDADQNLFVRLQFFAGGDQILRILNWLLVHFLNHVAFAQPNFSSRGVGINFCDHGSLDARRSLPVPLRELANLFRGFPHKDFNVPLRSRPREGCRARSRGHSWRRSRCTWCWRNRRCCCRSYSRRSRRWSVGVTVGVPEGVGVADGVGVGVAPAAQKISIEASGVTPSIS